MPLPPSLLSEMGSDTSSIAGVGDAPGSRQLVIASRKRPGRQKKYPKTISRKEALDRAEMHCARKLPIYLDTLEKLALGEVLVAKTTKDGDMVVFQQPPDPKSLMYLIDRGLGKIAQRYELTGDQGGPLKVVAWAEAEVIEGELA